MEKRAGKSPELLRTSCDLTMTIAKTHGSPLYNHIRKLFYPSILFSFYGHMYAMNKTEDDAILKNPIVKLHSKEMVKFHVVRHLMM